MGKVNRYVSQRIFDPASDMEPGRFLITMQEKEEIGEKIESKI